MNKQESGVLNVTRFLMSIFIVFLHAHTSVRMYDYFGNLPLYQHIIYLFSIQFGNVSVPTFFIISGYLFFLGYQQTWKCYQRKIKKRFFSLLLPYFFWNALMLIAFYIAECIPSVQDLFNDSRKLLHDCNFFDFLDAFWIYNDSAGPILTQLWFVRNLIVLAVLSPIIYIFIRYAKIVGLAFLGIWWIFAPGVPNLESSIFYFCLGAYFSIYGKSLTGEIQKIAQLLFLLFPLILIGDTLLDGTIIANYMHRIQVFTGVLFIIALVSVLIEKDKIRDITFLSSSSFFLYVAHDPMLRFMRKFSIKYVDYNSEFQMITLYFVTIVVNVSIVYVIFWLLRKYMPGFLKWTTGR